MKALVVDDDLALADIVSFTLRRAGFEVIQAHDGLAALDRWQSEHPDFVVLDLNLPKLDGLNVCRRIRRKDDTPIIILSVRGDEEDIIEGLKIGADDYIVKPFSPRQMVARAEAILRRSGYSHIPPGEFSAGKLRLDSSRCEAYFGNQLVNKLTKLEVRLLEMLIINRGSVVIIDSLLENVWGYAGGDRGLLKQLVYRLRKKIEPDPSKPTIIETIPGIGYCLNMDYLNE